MPRLALLVFFALVASASCQHVITCYMCQIGLQNMVTSMKANDEAMQNLGDSFSDGCDEIPQEQQRLGCRKLFSEHFNDVFDQFSTDPTTNPLAMCKNMKFC
uniref:Saposin B-type domain-containing protein n=1 Tax=Steinernema glaseri TaxID=37863 RepID=A0A1I7Y8V8_9BILA